MKHVSVYRRTGRPVWYVSFLDEASGKRKHAATVHRIEDPGSARRAYDEGVERSKAARLALPAGPAEAWDAWVPAWLELHLSGKSRIRYETAWRHVGEFLREKRIPTPRAVRYGHADEYLMWRTEQKRPRGTFINYNTALTELKVLASVMREAVRRGYAPGNPLAQLGLGRKEVKEKPDISDRELVVIRQALAKEPQWMRDCFEIGIHQGCRLSETGVKLDDVSTARNTITFHGKGGKVFTTALHPVVKEIAVRRHRQGCKVLCDLPPMAAKEWHFFFKRIGLGHLCFHSTRVTVITRLARSGVPQGLARTYVGHASDTIHRIYQRLTVADLSPVLAALGSPGGPAPTAQNPPAGRIVRKRASRGRA